MIAMHYRFTLPADYDMALIEQRIASNGARLDGFPGLLFKAYLYGRHDEAALPCRENRYAPFYVWQCAEAMRSFIVSEGFAALTRQFGWPHIETWHLLSAPQMEELEQARVAILRRTPIVPHSSLAELRTGAMLSGWDLSRWQWLEVDLLPSLPQVMPAGADAYHIGYLAKGSPLP
ncbi:hypothetical protein AH4AK4_3598 [Aeromonas hydrophila 4AK4]|nr:hypothetical protein AH4AK4_3598 [Aeromonas hydrophila 4AK4]